MFHNKSLLSLSLYFFNLLWLLYKSIYLKNKKNEACLSEGKVYMQRKYLCFSIASLLSTYAAADYSTFLRPRSVTFNQTFASALTHYHAYHDLVDIPWCSLSVTPFYQKSLRKEKTASLFLPNNKACISIREDGTGDVGSLWLGLISAPDTMFSSNICLNPRRTSYGAYLQARFNFDHFAPGLWMSLGGAYMKTKHTLGLCEFDLQNPGTIPGLATATQALNNPAWCFGKMSPATLCKTGFDDLLVKLGYDWFFCKENHIGIYALGGIPTGKKSKARFLFEPLVGSNFGSVGMGVQGDYALLCAGEQRLLLMGDAQYRYEFVADEIRSLDLCQQGRWSRFLQVVTPQALAFSQPGINFFTKAVRVKPRSTADLWLALHYACSDVHVELGYDFWYRQREKLALCSPALPEIGIYNFAVSCSGHHPSASRATISQAFDGSNSVLPDAVFTPVTTADLNRHSGASVRALSSTFFGGLSFNPTICSTSLLLGVFGSYELSHSAGALEQWAVGVKIGAQW